MEFKIGDKVAALDHDLEGVVKAITIDGILVETTDGFTVSFDKKELIKYKKTNGLSNINYTFNLYEVAQQKEATSKKKNLPVKKQKGEIPPPEIDLHIQQLVKHARHMSAFDMLTLQLDTAKYRLELAIRQRVPKLIFIHGVGDGVLKAELEFLLKRYAGVYYLAADYRKYGQGATEVIIKQQ